MTLPTMPPTGTNATPTQNIGQFPKTKASVPTVNAIVMMATSVQAAGVDPW